MDEHDDLSERLHRHAKEDEEKASAVNKVLKKPATLKCFIQVTVRASVEVDSEGCGDREGKEELFRSALNQFADATGVAADWDNDDLSCAVYVDGNPCLWLNRDWTIRDHNDPRNPIGIRY